MTNEERIDTFIRLRTERGLSQAECAKLLYCSLRRIQYWESGEREFDPALYELFLFKMAKDSSAARAAAAEAML